MKQIKSILYIFIATITLVSCDTYGDYEKEYSPVFPLSGQYVVTVYDENRNELASTYLYLSNTSANDTDKLWIKAGNSTVEWGILAKINCNVKNLEFNGEAPNLAFSSDGATSTENVNVTTGKLVLNGAQTPTGYKADQISVSYTSKGTNYTIEGFRFTGWHEDEE